MSNDHKGWIGVDLDGTLAKYDGWKGPEHIGEPVPAMIGKVNGWLADGRDVRIFTARVWHDKDPERYQSAAAARLAIEAWLLKHLGQVLPITCEKDFGMVELYDDRCVYVFPNQGITHKEHQGFLQAAFVDVAVSLGVRVDDGANFKAVADECAFRARAGARDRADKYEQVLALLDGAEDAMRYLKTQIGGSADLNRTHANLQRALPLLRELAGKA